MGIDAQYYLGPLIHIDINELAYVEEIPRTIHACPNMACTKHTLPVNDGMSFCSSCGTAIKFMEVVQKETYYENTYSLWYGLEDPERLMMYHCNGNNRDDFVVICLNLDADYQTFGARMISGYENTMVFDMSNIDITDIIKRYKETMAKYIAVLDKKGIKYTIQYGFVNFYT